MAEMVAGYVQGESVELACVFYNQHKQQEFVLERVKAIVQIVQDGSLVVVQAITLQGVCFEYFPEAQVWRKCGEGAEGKGKTYIDARLLETISEQAKVAVM